MPIYFKRKGPIEGKVKRHSLLQRFSLLSLAAFLVVGLALGAILTSSLEKTVVGRSKNETAQFVVAEVDRVFSGMDFSLPMTGPRYEDFQKGASHLIFDPSIKRIKVWNTDSVVVWSDERQLVGKQFPNDKELLEALNGTISSEISSLVKEENRTERQYHRVLELYIPIRFEHEGKVKAVVEIYQDLEDLDADTSRQKRILWIAIFGGFTGIYFACFGIVWRASRRLTEQTQGIEKSEERNRVIAQELTTLINNIPGVVYRGYRDWSISFIGAEVEQVTGYTAEEFIGGPIRWKELIHPSDLDSVKRIFREAAQEKNKVLRTEYRILHKDGSIRLLADRRQLTYDAEGNFAQVDGLLLDITEQKQAEEQIFWNYHTQKALTSILQVSIDQISLAEKMERALDFIFEVPWIKVESKGCIFLVEDDQETLVMAANRGISPEILSTCGKVAFGKCLCGKAASTRKMIFSGGGHEDHEFHRDKAGNHGHYCVPMLSNDKIVGVLNLCVLAGNEETDRETGFLTSVCNTLTGMIERDRTEKGLERLATAVEQAEEIIMITDLNGGIQYVNPSFERITGYRCVEAIGKNPRILKSGKQDEDFYKGMWSTLLRDEVWTGRLTNRCKDGTLYEQETVISPVRNASGKVVNYVGVLRDNTRERQLEDQLRQSQKMEAIGTLAGGVAHDFNNLLTVIEGYSDLLLSRLGEGNPLAAEVREIRKASDSASSLTKQMLAFSRMQVFLPKVLDLNDLVANIKKMLARLIGENIELVTFPGEDLGRVKADPGQIEQVLLNLVVNARDAIPNGGRITIETSNVDLDESFARKQVTFRPGPYVMLTVADTGTGMDKETMSRIFEPFFTTKEIGKGTGLGLATVYGIVKQSNGYIWTYSEPGHGTIFKIHLPRVDEQPEEEAPPPQIPAQFSGSETVLVVEDTEMVRNLVREVLENFSYTVLEASDGNEALALCERRKEPIHLLVTDMMMPKMSGADLAQAVSSTRPGIRVLYMSGYTEYGSAENSGLPSGSFFIQKPFSVAGLARKVREVLDS
jgi:PAS domain S-box-containing protein